MVRLSSCPIAVYPRVCGGTAATLLDSDTRRGLSPRVRGNQPRWGLSNPGRWSIPACAGEPFLIDTGSPPEWVYPRVCGGTGRCRTRSGMTRGLSPRVRGNPPAYRVQSAGRGSIPACAGEPGAPPIPPRRRTVYPRVCGGTTALAAALRNRGGLSPRVRGNLLEKSDDLRRVGSIPACAGEPRWWGMQSRSLRVYPRVCGGTPRLPGRGRRRRGLSPRVRGNRGQMLLPGVSTGSIPACAGEPAGVTASEGALGVYPRVCGGTPWRFDSDPCYRIRHGNNAAPLATFYQIRAGTVQSRSRLFQLLLPSGKSGGYPRICGETSVLLSTNKSASGLSPRVRGTSSIEHPAHQR